MQRPIRAQRRRRRLHHRVGAGVGRRHGDLCARAQPERRLDAPHPLAQAQHVAVHLDPQRRPLLAFRREQPTARIGGVGPIDAALGRAHGGHVAQRALQRDVGVALEQQRPRLGRLDGADEDASQQPEHLRPRRSRGAGFDLLALRDRRREAGGHHPEQDGLGRRAARTLPQHLAVIEPPVSGRETVDLRLDHTQQPQVGDHQPQRGLDSAARQPRLQRPDDIGAQTLDHAEQLLMGAQQRAAGGARAVEGVGAEGCGAAVRRQRRHGGRVVCVGGGEQAEQRARAGIFAPHVQSRRQCRIARARDCGGKVPQFKRQSAQKRRRLSRVAPQRGSKGAAAGLTRRRYQARHGDRDLAVEQRPPASGVNPVPVNGAHVARKLAQQCDMVVQPPLLRQEIAVLQRLRRPVRLRDPVRHTRRKSGHVMCPGLPPIISATCAQGRRRLRWSAIRHAKVVIAQKS